MAEQDLDIQHTDDMKGTPECMVLRAEGLVKKYGSYESKLDEIRQAAAYIAQVNAKLRNFEIAKNVDTILALTGEMK